MPETQTAVSLGRGESGWWGSGGRREREKTIIKKRVNDKELGKQTASVGNWFPEAQRIKLKGEFKNLESLRGILNN